MMIAKLERTQTATQTNKNQTQTLTTNGSINKQWIKNDSITIRFTMNSGTLIWHNDKMQLTLLNQGMTIIDMLILFMFSSGKNWK